MRKTNNKPLQGKGIREMHEVKIGATCYAQAVKNAGRTVSKPTGRRLYPDDKIKSALEHLKEGFCHRRKIGKLLCGDNCVVCNKIEQSFPVIIW